MAESRSYLRITRINPRVPAYLSSPTSLRRTDNGVFAPGTPTSIWLAVGALYLVYLGLIALDLRPVGWDGAFPSSPECTGPEGVDGGSIQ
jgi:hypothetical protein